MQNGFIRVASASPRVSVADVAANVSEIKVLMAEAAEKGADLTVFPEMSLTAYTCADLFHSRELLDSARSGLDALAAESAKYPGAAFVVGVPVEAFGALYNCAAVLAGGRLCGIVPKTYVPGYNEFYERRWFSSSEDLLQKSAQRNRYHSRNHLQWMDRSQALLSAIISELPEP